MAKSSRNNKPRQATQLAAELVPASVSELEIVRGVTLNAEVTLADLQDVFIVEQEDQLNEEKASLQLAVSRATERHKQLTAALEKDARELAQTYSNPLADQLAGPLGAFIGMVYTTVTQLSSINIEKELVVVTHFVLSTTDKTRSEQPGAKLPACGSHLIAEQPKPGVLQFTPAMQENVKQQATIAAEVADLQDQLAVVTRKLIDLPRMARRIKAKLTTAVITGEVRNGADIIERMQSASQPKAIPHVK